MLSIQNLFASIDDHPVLKGVTLQLGEGEVHAIMGPNGSGKSTLVNALIGTGDYSVSADSLTFNGQDLLQLSVHERAQKGLFVSFQSPPAIPGLRVVTLLQEIRRAQSNDILDPKEFMNELNEYLQLLEMDQSFLERSCNDGFSGGERKRLELLQLLVAQPKLLIFDEIDSGLDIDALKIVARVVEWVKARNPRCIVLIITHYKRILSHIAPDYVHLLVNGTIEQSGDAQLVDAVEQTGYMQYSS